MKDKVAIVGGGITSYSGKLFAKHQIAILKRKPTEAYPPVLKKMTGNGRWKISITIFYLR